ATRHAALTAPTSSRVGRRYRVRMSASVGRPAVIRRRPNRRDSPEPEESCPFAPTATIVRPAVTRTRESARETGSCKELDAQMTEGVRDQPDRPSAGESVMSTRTQRDIVFAHARIGYNKGHGSMQVVALKLDAYLPAVPARTPSPALVLAHGGVFHLGSKESDVFSDGTGTTTAIAEYCRRFAVLGWPSFSVQYRLAQMDPEPSREPVLTR